MAMLAASAHHRATGFANKISFGVKEVGIRGVWRRDLTAARGCGTFETNVLDERDGCRQGAERCISATVRRSFSICGAETSGWGGHRPGGDDPAGGGPRICSPPWYTIVGQQISTKGAGHRLAADAGGAGDRGQRERTGGGTGGLAGAGHPAGARRPTSRTLPPGSERSLRPGDGAGEQRCGGHPAAVYPEGRGGVDGGDDPAVLPAKTGYFQL